VASHSSVIDARSAPPPSALVQRPTGPASEARPGGLPGVLAGLLLAAVALPASGAVLGSYYSPRLVAFYLLVLTLPAAYLVAQLRRPSDLSLDPLDFALLAFAAWQLLAAAAAPTALLGWFGAYNRHCDENRRSQGGREENRCRPRLASFSLGRPNAESDRYG
jgi:hypothetical protein